ncbi:MAG: hypothetical protein ACOX4K_01000 [Bacillota bacterium]
MKGKSFLQGYWPGCILRKEYAYVEMGMLKDGVLEAIGVSVKFLTKREG